MRYMKNLFLGLLASAVCLTAVSLADAAPKKPAKPGKAPVKIVGTWKSQYVKNQQGDMVADIIDFQDDGTYTGQSVDKEGEVVGEFSGQYTIQKGALTLSNDEGKVIFKAKVAVNGKTMILTFANGNKLRYTRVEDKGGDDDNDDGSN